MESPSPSESADSLLQILSRLLPTLDGEVLQAMIAGLKHTDLPAEEVQQQLQNCETERQQARMEALAEFAAGAGHEANNPLATISGRVELLLREETDPERRRALTTIGGQALRVRDMIGDVMLFARPPAPRPERVELSEAVAQAIKKLQPTVMERQCRISITVNDQQFLHADPHQLQIVLTGLLRNSLDAVADGEGEILIDSFCRAEQSSVELTVTDNGHGFTELDRVHLFDPFYSGRQAGRGLGFGLCKCQRIVSNHGGRITVDASEHQTVFRVFWPLADE